MKNLILTLILLSATCVGAATSQYKGDLYMAGASSNLVAVTDPNGKIITDTNLTYDPNKNSLTINQNAAAGPTNLSGTVLSLRGADNSMARMGISSFGAGGSTAFANRHADGTAASPSAVGNNRMLMSFEGWGYGATAYSTGARVMLRGFTANAWSDTSQGTYISFLTTPTNTIVPVERMRIQQDGSIIGNGSGLTNIAAASVNGLVGESERITPTNSNNYFIGSNFTSTAFYGGGAGISNVTVIPSNLKSSIDWLGTDGSNTVANLLGQTNTVLNWLTLKWSTINYDNISRIRREGRLASLTLLIKATNGASAIYLDIWRPNPSAGTNYFDLLYRTNVFGKVVTNTYNTFYISDNVIVRPGDTTGVAVDGASSESSMIQASTASTHLCWYWSSGVYTNTVNPFTNTAFGAAIEVFVTVTNNPVLCGIGDSTMAGYYINPSYTANFGSYMTNDWRDPVTYVGKALGVPSENWGVSGYTVTNSFDHAKTNMLVLTHPKVVEISLFLNDALKGSTVAEMTNGAVAIFDLFETNRIKFLWRETCPINSLTNLAMQTNITLANLAVSNILEHGSYTNSLGYFETRKYIGMKYSDVSPTNYWSYDTGMTTDAVHPSMAGYVKWNDAFLSDFYARYGTSTNIFGIASFRTTPSISGNPTYNEIREGYNPSTGVKTTNYYQYSSGIQTNIVWDLWKNPLPSGKMAVLPYVIPVTTASLALTTNYTLALDSGGTYTNMFPYNYAATSSGYITVGTNSFTNSVAGYYNISANASFRLAANTGIEAALFTNTAECALLEFMRDTSTALTNGASSSVNIWLPANTRMGFLIKSVSGGAIDPIFTHVNFNVQGPY